MTAVLTLLCAVAVIAQDSETAPPPPAKAPPPVPTDIQPEAKVVLDRLIKQYAPLKGVKVIAKHQIKGQNRILHEQVRLVEIVKPNCFRITADGLILAVSNGTSSWKIDRQAAAYAPRAAPASLPEALIKAPELGGGSIGGSGGLIAALLSPDPMHTLTRDVSHIEVTSYGDKQVLIFTFKANPGTVRPGTKLGVIVPTTGPCWMLQADVVPPNVAVFTRIIFEQWALCDLPPSAFELDPELPRIPASNAPAEPRGTTPTSP